MSTLREEAQNLIAHHVVIALVIFGLISAVWAGAGGWLSLAVVALPADWYPDARPGPGARVDAPGAAGTTFGDWTWAPGSAAWAKVQTLHVPIQYGSSG